MTQRSTQDPLPLPGLADPTPGTSELEVQVRRSLRFMVANDMVDDRHAGLMELAIQLARSITPTGKAYGNAQAAAQLLATWDKLLPPEGGDDGDGLNDLRAYLAGVDAGRSST